MSVRRGGREREGREEEEARRCEVEGESGEVERRRGGWEGEE